MSDARIDGLPGSERTERSERTTAHGDAPRPAPTPPRRLRALECRVEGGGIAIPVEAVGQIVEYEVAPLPLARGAVRGLGLIDGKLVVSLGVGRCADGRRRTKGVLLRTSDASGHWALEVTEVLAFIEVDAPSRTKRGQHVATADKRELAWIDADHVVANADALFAEGASR